MPIAMHLSIEHDLPYWQMCGNWHRLAEMDAKRHLPRAAMLAAGHHPLPLVDNIKNYSIDNTRYFNAQFISIIKIYKVRLVCYF